MRTTRHLRELGHRYLPRWVQAIIASIYITFRGSPCFVWSHGRDWRFRFRGYSAIRMTLSSRTLHSDCTDTQDYFCYEYVPAPGDVILDIGAGVGEAAALFNSQVGPKGTVIAVEAHPDAFRCLSEAVRLNGLDNFICLQFACSNSVGATRLSDVDGSYDIGSSIVSTADKLGFYVTALRLDAVLDDLGLDRIDFLKMNIEGAEVDALHGMGSALHLVQHCAISCHDFLARRNGDDAFATRHKVLQILRGAGFTIVEREDHRPWAADTIYGYRVSVHAS